MKQTVKHALVLGLGSSGEAAARLVMRHGAAVTGIDAQAGAAQESRATLLREAGGTVIVGSPRLPEGPFDLAVLSPGIAITDPWVAELRARAVPVISELELGWRYRRSRILAVTGSNGKSTLVKFCRDVLRQAGFHAEAGGNYGEPLSALVLRDPAPDWIVAEVSSFQLEAVAEFAPEAGILLNLNPNHLDRHGTMEVYAAMKARLFARMGKGCRAILPEGIDARVARAVPGAAMKVLFGAGPAADYRYREGVVEGPDGQIDLRGSAFDNPIMGQTAAACAAAVAPAAVPAGAITAAALAFERLPHRMQRVAEVAGVLFVNDSKATNLAALEAGIRMACGPVRLIAGGLLKETDLQGVKKILANQVRGVYIIGKYSRAMASAWSDAVPCHECGTLDRAVQAAWTESRPGEVVLLSPGCASFDQFKSFEERGKRFVDLVSDIKKERDRE